MVDGRKASTAPASEDESPMKAVARKDAKDHKIKLKRPVPKPNKPSNWRAGSAIDDDKRSKLARSPSVGSAGSPGPATQQSEENNKEGSTAARPLDDGAEATTCKHCKKNISKSAYKSHVEGCQAARKEFLRKKKEMKEKAKRKEEVEKEKDDKPKQDKVKEKDKAKPKKVEVDEDGDARMDNDDDDADGVMDTPDLPLKKLPGSIKSAKKSAGKKTDFDMDKKGKKRKLDDAEKGPKPKKKKDEPKPKVAKPKGPVDVERQCGVITPSGAPCARSLTCKSHSMGAKRGVPGRSLPYDMLLAAYQKKNQAKQQKAALDANAPLEDEDEANAGPVDSDEETAAVMTALSKWNPQPVVPQPILMPIKRQYQLARLREQLDNATSGGSVNIFKVVSKNGLRLADGENEGEDAPGEPDFGLGISQGSRRTSLAFGLQQPPTQAQRRASQAAKT